MSDDVKNDDTGDDAVVTTIPSEIEAEPRRVVSGHIHWRNTFQAFRHRNFRIFFLGMGISLIGTWMQTTAESWLVFELTRDPLALGGIRFLHSIPVTVLSIFGGHIADQFNKRNILIGTQTLAMILALSLFVLVWTGWVAVWHVAVLAVFLGLVQAFDIPARQSLIVELVGKRDLMNAIALNSSIFNGARVIGPAAAGVLIAMVGMAGCFLLNALSFIPIIGSYFLIRMPRREVRMHPLRLGEAMREAFAHVSGDRVLRSILLLVATASLFAWPYSVLMPVIAGEVLGLGAKGYGGLMAANGAGAFLGALCMATLGDFPHRKRVLLLGAFGFCVTIWAFAVSRTAGLSGLFLACSGWFMILFFSTANTMVQLRTPDHLRGRIMGVYSFCFIGLTPFGSLLAGAVARTTSASFAIQMGACVCVVMTLVTLGRLRRQAV